MVLKLLQLSYQSIPATLGDTDGEHDEERVQTALLYDHAVLSQVLGHNARWDTHRAEVTFNI